MIRPEVIALILRAREVLWAMAVIGFGAWLIWLGGYLLAPLGGAVAVLGAGLALLALRRMRFAQAVDAPGVVEVDEGQVGYYGPNNGGFVSLPELVELRLLTMRGRRLWRLKQLDGQALLIPVEAAGAERLFDAFASLPGMDTGALVAVLDQPTDAPTGAGQSLTSSAAEMHLVWRRKGAGVVAR